MFILIWATHSPIKDYFKVWATLYIKVSKAWSVMLLRHTLYHICLNILHILIETNKSSFDSKMLSIWYLWASQDTSNNLVWTARNNSTAFRPNTIIGRATCLFIYLPPGSSQAVRTQAKIWSSFLLTRNNIAIPIVTELHIHRKCYVVTLCYGLKYSLFLK